MDELSINSQICVTAPLPQLAELISLGSMSQDLSATAASVPSSGSASVGVCFPPPSPSGVDISVITPVYNGAAHLPACIASIAAQDILLPSHNSRARCLTHRSCPSACSRPPVRVEWSVYDDASTDSTAAVVLSHAPMLAASGVSLVFSSFSHPAPIRVDAWAAPDELQRQLAAAAAAAAASVPVSPEQRAAAAAAHAPAPAPAPAPAAAASAAEGAGAGGRRPKLSKEDIAKLQAEAAARKLLKQQQQQQQEQAQGQEQQQGKAGSEGSQSPQVQQAAKRTPPPPMPAASPAVAVAATTGVDVSGDERPVAADACLTPASAPSSASAPAPASVDTPASAGSRPKRGLPPASSAAAPVSAPTPAPAQVDPVDTPLVKDVGHGRNRAILQSRGCWLVMVDADDAMALRRVRGAWEDGVREWHASFTAAPAAAAAAPSADCAPCPCPRPRLPPPLLLGGLFVRLPAGSTPRYAHFLNSLTAADAAKLRHRDLTLIQPTWTLARTAYASTFWTGGRAQAREWARALWLQGGLAVDESKGAGALSGLDRFPHESAGEDNDEDEDIRRRLLLLTPGPVPLAELGPVLHRACAGPGAKMSPPRSQCTPTTTPAPAAEVGQTVSNGSVRLFTFDPPSLALSAGASSNSNAVGAGASIDGDCGGLLGSGYPQTGLGTPEDLALFHRLLLSGTRLALPRRPPLHYGTVYRHDNASASASVKAGDMLSRRAKHFEATVLKIAPVPSVATAGPASASKKGKNKAETVSAAGDAADQAATGARAGECAYLRTRDIVAPSYSSVSAPAFLDDDEADSSPAVDTSVATAVATAEATVAAATEGADTLPPILDDIIAMVSIRIDASRAAGQDAQQAEQNNAEDEEDTGEQWQRGFGIWGGGRDGKRFYNSLSGPARDLVRCFYDVDPSRIGTVYREHGGTRSVPIRAASEVEAPFVVCVARDDGREGQEGTIPDILGKFWHGKDYLHMV